MFRHHPDGRIHIGGAVLPIDEFLIDEPAYALPAGATGRVYEPGGRHVLSDGKSQWAGPVPWAEGDTYLAAEATYAANYAARTAPPEPTLAELQADAAALVDRQAEAARGQWITLGAGQAMAYEAKRREAERWAVDAAPGPANYPWARARAARLNGVTPPNVTVAQAQAVIDEWTARAAAWEAAGIAIEEVREQAKEDIAATDQAAIDAILAGLAWPSPV